MQDTNQAIGFDFFPRLRETELNQRAWREFLQAIADYYDDERPGQRIGLPFCNGVGTVMEFSVGRMILRMPMELQRVPRFCACWDSELLNLSEILEIKAFVRILHGMAARSFPYRTKFWTTSTTATGR